MDRTHDLQALTKLSSWFPVTGILGPRQCGKTTMARQIGADHFFDLEHPGDLAALASPMATLERLSGRIVLDEVQRRPDLFPIIRVLVDAPIDRKFILLGSASPDLLRQSSESLAGRIAYHRLGGFRLADVGQD
ncbi:MAG TPA: AAA family ATPase, partial [Fibrobacteria bacterium]|nr:AAA family ATPase [Fibrobacteria bacterium]